MVTVGASRISAWIDQDTTTRLLAGAARWPTCRCAVEGANGLGHTIAQQLVAADETVIDVPATLTARARLPGAGSRRKTQLSGAPARLTARTTTRASAGPADRQAAG